MNETKHIRMCDPHHSHVCATPHTTLLHYIRHLVDDVHERHWTRSNSSRRAYHCSVWSQKFISHSCAAASLMNGGGSLCVIHDSSQRIGNVQNKTCRELAM